VISTVFQAYLTTFLIEPGYEERIRSVEQMLNSERKFGFTNGHKILFSHASDPSDMAFVKDAVRCPDIGTCFIWASVYQNITTILDDFYLEIYRGSTNWTDGNNRPLLCKLENGDVRTLEFAIFVMKGNPFIEFIDKVMRQVVEGGIFIYIKKRGFHRTKLELKVDFPIYVDTFYAISIRHLQAAFYLVMLGYVLALACFVIEITWHRYVSKER
jgi:hypothetical protein